MWLLRLKRKLTLFILIASTVSCSRATNQTEDSADIPLSRHSRAVSGPSIDWFDVYAKLKKVPTLSAYIKDVSVAAFNAVGWITVTSLWTLSGFSSVQEPIFTYDFIGRIYRHFSDPQEAAFRTAVNLGTHTVNAFLLLWLASKNPDSPGVITRRKRTIPDQHIGHTLLPEGFHDMEDKGFHDMEDRIDNFCDTSGSFLDCLLSSVDRMYKFPTALIWARNNLILFVAGLIYWTLLGTLPDPKIIMAGFGS